jgi:hypothetical protein
MAFLGGRAVSYERGTLVASYDGVSYTSALSRSNLSLSLAHPIGG